MSLLARYFSPTTPGAATFTVDVTSTIRLGSITGLVGEAELGAVGEGNIVLDDTASTVGYLSDGIVGLKQMIFNELDCPIGNQRLWTGYIGDRRYHRGQSDSLITGAARKIDVTLVDTNAFASFRVFAPTADDPTSDFDRPAETDIARIAALLTTVDFLSTTLFDIGYVNTTGPVAMDANDYTGSRPSDVLNDCAQMSGKNYWIKYNEAANKLFLWYDFVGSDGSDTIAYDSTLRLTNVLSEHDGSTTFAIAPDAVGVLDPSRVISSVYVNGNGITAYRTRPATANTFAWRDGAPISSSVKTLAKAQALGDRYLTENATEDNRISCTVQVPSSKVTALVEGMRVQAHFTHLPGVASAFTWCRVLQRTIRQDVENNKYYWLDLELSPATVPTDYVIAALMTTAAPSGIVGVVWPAGWTQDIAYKATHGFRDNQYIYVAHGPIGGNSVVVTAGGSNFSNSNALVAIEVLGTSVLAPDVIAGFTEYATDSGGSAFVMPSTTVSGDALLLQFQTRQSSATSWNDPMTGWTDLDVPFATTTNSLTIPMSGTISVTTQAGLTGLYTDMPIKLYSAANPANFQDAYVSASGYSGTTLSFGIGSPNINGGSGTHTDWVIAARLWDAQSIGDTQLYNVQYRQVTAGTYTGSEAVGPGANDITALSVVAAFLGGSVTIGRVGTSGNQAGVMTLTAVLR